MILRIKKRTLTLTSILTNMDTKLRERFRKVISVDYFALDQESRVRYLNQRIRAGVLEWSNNIRDVLCSAGIEDFVLLIGGPSAPREQKHSVWSYKSTDSWSADPKHKPLWLIQRQQMVMRRIIKLGGQRAKEATSGYEPCCGNEILTGLYGQKVCKGCQITLTPKCKNMDDVRRELIKEYLL